MGYQNFFATRLYTDIGASDVTITLETPPTETSGHLVLEARNPTQREIVRYTGVSGNAITGVTRGQGGTTAKSHVKNALVEMNLVARDLQDALGVPGDIITRFNEVLADHVTSGLVWSQVSLLTGAMTAGVIYLNGYRVSVPALASYAFPASKDIYVDIDVTGTLYYTPVANGATTGFALAADRIRLAKVVTDATTITRVFQTPLSTGMTGAQEASGLDILGNRVYPTSPTGELALWTDADLMNPIPTAATYVSNSAITFKVPFNCVLDITISCWIQVNAGAATWFYLFINGANVGRTIHLYNTTTASDGKQGATRRYIKALAAGTHTIDMRINANVANAAVLNEPSLVGTVKRL